MAALSVHKKLMNVYVTFKKHLLKQNISLKNPTIAVFLATKALNSVQNCKNIHYDHMEHPKLYVASVFTGR